jgi:hypothetical protein
MLLARLGDQRALKVLERLEHDPNIHPILRHRARNARKRLSTRTYLDMTVDQRVIQEVSERSGRLGRWLATILTPFQELILPFIVRRYSQVFDELVNDNTDKQSADETPAAALTRIDAPGGGEQQIPPAAEALALRPVEKMSNPAPRRP